MRFVVRSLTGLLLCLLTAGPIAYGVVRLGDAREAAAVAPRGGPAAERVYAVETVTAAPQTVRPALSAFGEIASARRLELRPAAAGRLVELSAAFAEGGAVEAGELLFRIDPASAEADLTRAEIALDEAGAEVSAAARAVELAGRDVAASETQRDLRESALARQEDIARRGAGSDAAVEAAALALSAAEQQVIAREQALAAARTRAETARVARDRAELALADAGRALAETEVRAPFAGLLTETAAVLGRQVSANEKLGALVDLTRLEAAFRVTNAEYARLVDEGGALRPLPASIRLSGEAAATGELARAAAAAGDLRTGRTVYARLGAGAGAVLREGDFVAVEVQEPPLEGVGVIPAAAATADGRILVVNADDRLEERRVEILRRDGDRLVVADAPWGERLVAIRKPQLGPGVKARVTEENAEAAAADAASPAPGFDGGPEAAERLVALTPERRAALATVVEEAADLAPDVKSRLLDRLSAPEAPARMVEGLEARLPRASGG